MQNPHRHLHPRLGTLERSRHFCCSCSHRWACPSGQHVIKLTAPGLLLLSRLLLLLLHLGHHLHAGWEGMLYAGDALHVWHPHLVLLLLLLLLLLVPAYEHKAPSPAHRRTHKSALKKQLAKCQKLSLQSGVSSQH